MPRVKMVPLFWIKQLKPSISIAMPTVESNAEMRPSFWTELRLHLGIKALCA
jgi:hypothetical protein